MLDNAKIYSYQATGTDGQKPGALYKELSKKYGSTGADTIATAARTGDDKAVFDAEAKLKPGYVAPVAAKSKFNWWIIGGGVFVVLLAATFILKKKKKS